MQAVTYINGKSDLPVYVQHAAEYYTTGNRRLTKDSLVILSSVTGTTQDMMFTSMKLKSIQILVSDVAQLVVSVIQGLLRFLPMLVKEEEQWRLLMVVKHGHH